MSSRASDPMSIGSATPVQGALSASAADTDAVVRVFTLNWPKHHWLCRHAVELLVAHAIHSACADSPQDWTVLAEMQRLAWEVYSLKLPALQPVLPPAGKLPFCSCTYESAGRCTAGLSTQQHA